MKKVVFLASLAIITGNVLGMNSSDKKIDIPAVMSLREVGKYISDQRLSLKSVCEYADSDQRSDDNSKLSAAATMLKKCLTDARYRH